MPPTTTHSAGFSPVDDAQAVFLQRPGGDAAYCTLLSASTT